MRAALCSLDFRHLFALQSFAAGGRDFRVVTGKSPVFGEEDCLAKGSESVFNGKFSLGRRIIHYSHCTLIDLEERVRPFDTVAFPVQQ